MHPIIIFPPAIELVGEIILTVVGQQFKRYILIHWALRNDKNLNTFFIKI